jgi:Calx-beta domain
MFNCFYISISFLVTLVFPIIAIAQPSLPTVGFSRSNYVVSENDKDSKVLTLIRDNGDLSKPSTVKLMITKDSTASVDDYDANKIELTVEFKPGESLKTITIPIKNDNDLEEKESINFAIEAVDGAKLGLQATTTLEINDVDTSKLPNAIRFAVVNGVVEYVNNTQQAIIALEWDLLPLEGNKQLIKSIQEYYPISKPITCSIRNEDLDTKKWINNLSKDCQKHLVDAFRVNDLSGLEKELTLKSGGDSKVAEPEFTKFWTTPGNEGYKIVTTSGISASQYYGALRDYSQMKLLLSSSGITYYFNVSGDSKPQGDFPRISDKDINWEIKIHRFPASKNFSLYRYTAKAVIDPFKLVFPAMSSAESSKSTPPAAVPVEPPKNATQAEIHIKFKKSEATIGLIEPNLTETSLPIEFSPVVKEKISTLKETSSDQELITSLGFFFNLKNAELGKLVSNNFLGNLQNSSIITGGLISEKSVDSLVGINTQLADVGDIKLGAIIGIGINNNNPLFVGPSLSYSGLTVSAGARISSKNDEVKFDPSALISLDLSQSIGGQQQNKKISVDKNQAGGKWGVASDLISQNLALVYWTATTDDTSLLVNNEDCNGSIIPKENQAKIPLKTFNNASKLAFIPRGKYEYQKRILDFCRAEGVNKL